MPDKTSTDLVWAEITRRSFAVLSYVTPNAEARSAGVVYVVRNRVFYIRTDTDSWKARHIRLNPSVALNVTIPKRVPLMPWIRIPDATIAFGGIARVIDGQTADPDLAKALATATGHALGVDEAICFIEVTPAGQFLTHAVGVSLLDMRYPAKARARVAVD